MKVIPPNFGYVEEAIFRCGAPEPRHYGFLSSLGLRTCVLLTDVHDDAFVCWLQESGVTIFCPLMCASQPSGGFYGGSPPYTVASAAEEGGGTASRRRGGGESHTAAWSSFRGAATPNSNPPNKRDSEDVHDGTFPSTIFNGTDVLGSTTNRSHLSSTDNANTTYVETDGLGDVGGESRDEGRGGNGGLSIGGGGGRGGSTMTSSSFAMINVGSSNAARFLQEHGSERASTVQFSPAIMAGPLQFPASGARTTASGGYGTAAPSYEGKLHSLMTLSEAVVVSILNIVLDPQYYPLLITCAKGRYRTGIVCGCLRKLQGWTLVSILEEYRRFAGDKSRADNEEFIELFDEELVNLELADGRRPTILYNL